MASPALAGVCSDAVGDAAGEIVLEPADRLAQHLPVGAPADQRAELRQDAVVQERHVDALDQRAERQDEDGGGDQLPAVGGEDGRRLARRHHVDDAAHVPDQADFPRWRTATDVSAVAAKTRLNGCE